MMDLKNYPGKLVEKANPKGWWYWTKHHLVTFIIIGAAVAFVIGFIWGKSSIIVFDNNQKMEFKPGVKILYHTELPSAYKYKDPTLVDIMCVDGVKMVVFDEGLSSQVLGGCE